MVLGVDIVKLFSSSLTLRSNKLERFSLASTHKTCGLYYKIFTIVMVRA
jgi:hypothetical protein